MIIKIMEENGTKYTVKTDTVGTILWYKEGTNILHRENGPAVNYADGSKSWYVEGECHRDDGPAVQNVNGSKCWYKEGKLHKEDGPAVEYANGDKEYWLNHKYLDNIYSNEELMIKLLLE